METLWDIWYYFILVGVWVFYGIDLLGKFYIYSKIKKYFNNDYNTFPEIGKIKKWRLIFTWVFISLAVLMLIMSFIKGMNYLYFIPILIIAGIIYINGKLKNKIVPMFPVMFFNQSGFTTYPCRKCWFKNMFHKWDNVESYDFIIEKAYHNLYFHFQDGSEYKFMINRNLKDQYEEILDKYIKN